MCANAYTCITIAKISAGRVSIKPHYFRVSISSQCRHQWQWVLRFLCRRLVRSVLELPMGSAYILWCAESFDQICGHVNRFRESIWQNSIHSWSKFLNEIKGLWKYYKQTLIIVIIKEFIYRKIGSFRVLVNAYCCFTTTTIKTLYNPSTPIEHQYFIIKL